MPNPPSDPNAQRYYPTETDLGSPDRIRAAFQQVLTQHYELMDAHSALQTAHTTTLAQVRQLTDTPPPNGPTNTLLLGLPVIPVDTNTLPNGATFKWDKVSGSWKIS